MNKRTRAIEQAEYCKSMMKRIVDDLKTNAPHYEETMYLEKHTVTQNDIVHLRRELLKLSKMVGSEWK